jgi:hypothetical protein
MTTNPMDDKIDSSEIYDNVLDNLIPAARTESTIFEEKKTVWDDILEFQILSADPSPLKPTFSQEKLLKDVISENENILAQIDFSGNVEFLKTENSAGLDENTSAAVARDLSGAKLEHGDSNPSISSHSSSARHKSSGGSSHRSKKSSSSASFRESVGRSLQSIANSLKSSQGLSGLFKKKSSSSSIKAPNADSKEVEADSNNVPNQITETSENVPPTLTLIADALSGSAQTMISLDSYNTNEIAELKSSDEIQTNMNLSSFALSDFGKSSEYIAPA